MKTANKNLQFICLRKVGSVYYIWTNELEDCLEKKQGNHRQNKQKLVGSYWHFCMWNDSQGSWNSVHGIMEPLEEETG